MSGRMGNKVGIRVKWTAALFMAGLAGQAAFGTSKFYVGPQNGGAADWNAAGSWSATSGGAGGAGIPGSADVVGISNTDGVSRTVLYDYTGAAVTLNSLNIDLTGGSSTTTNTLNMPGNTLTVNGLPEEIGISGNGSFNQTGGTNTSDNALYLGLNANSNGAYTLNGATAVLALNQFETVGQSGVGNFNLVNGTNTVNSGNALFIGGASGGVGTYTIGTIGGGGAGTLSVSGNEAVGFSGTGSMVQYSGLNTLTGATSILYVGYNAGAPTAKYTLSGGALVAGGADANSASEYVGFNGNGSFTQSGGIHSVTAALDLGGNAGSTGAYSLSGGSLIAGNEIIGVSGTGALVQSGGSNALAPGVFLNGSLYLGDIGSGSYTLNGASASLTVPGYEFVGYEGAGSFVQSAGTNGVNDLEIAEQQGSTGTFVLSGGTLAATRIETIGFQGAGTLVQSGGTNTVGDPNAGGGFMVIGSAASSQGTYTMNNAAAVLTVNGDLDVGGSAGGFIGNGPGVMNISAGTATVTGTLKIGTTTGCAVNLSGGTLNVGALDATSLPRINWTGGTLGFLGNVSVGTGDALGTNFSLNAKQTLSVAGTLTVDATGSFTLNGGTLSANSINAVNGVLSFNSGAVSVTTLSVGTLALYTPLTLSSTGSLNGQTVRINPGGSLSIHGASGFINNLFIYGSTVNGAPTSQPPAAFHYTSGTFAVDTCQISGAVLAVATGEAINPQSAMIIFNESTVSLTGGSISTPNFQLYNQLSTLNIASGFVSAVDALGHGQFYSSGEIDLGNYATAAIYFGDGGLDNFGILQGSGQVKNVAAFSTAPLTNESGAQINVSSTDHLSFNFTVENSGRINIVGGLMQLGGVHNITGGTVNLTGGSLNVTADAVTTTTLSALNATIYNESGGIISGHGTLQGIDPIDNAGKIQLSGGNSDIYPGIINESSGKITVTGGSTATFYGAMTLKSGSALTVDINSTAVFFGSVTGTATITGAGTLDFEGGHSVTPALANLGDVTVGGLAALTAPSVQVGALVVQGNLVTGPTAPAQAKVLNTANTLTVTTGATFDLTNTDLLLHSGSVATVQSWVTLGEIHSSSAAPNLTGLGLLSGADYLTLHGPAATFDGSLVLTTDTLVRFTYLGDATLDGKISVADYAQIDAGFLLHQSPTWLTGDFNLDGLINYKDYALIDNAYRNQSGALADGLITEHAQEFGSAYTAYLAPLASPAAAPEPGTLAVIALGCFGLLRRTPTSSKH